MTPGPQDLIETTLTAVPRKQVNQPYYIQPSLLHTTIDDCRIVGAP